jgi:hypothetical protein
MKQFASWFTHGVHNGSHLRKAIYDAKDEHTILTEVERFFESILAAPPVAEPIGEAASL